MNNFRKWSPRIINPDSDALFEGRSVTQVNQVRLQPLPAFTSRRQNQPRPASTSAEPRGADCLNKILQEIRATLAMSSLPGDQDYTMYLHVIDDIDFDCQQPFLAQVLEELISNAVSAMTRQTDARIDVTATQYEGRLFVQVADNGPGLPAGMSAWITNWAYDRDKCQRHKGSGLDTAALLIAIAGGHLEVVHSLPSGTRFGFSVPLPNERAANHRNASASPSVND